MPYVKDYERPDLDKVVAFMKAKKVTPTGRLNYVLYKLAQDMTSYNEYKAFLGELECVKLEIYRRQLALYEDQKIEENGDV